MTRSRIHELPAWTVALFSLVVLEGQATAQLGFPILDVFRAADGTAYQVIRARANERFRVTTIAGGTPVLGVCFETNSHSGDPASAVSGADPNAAQELFPYAQTVRTHVLIPNDISSVSFDQHFGGRVTLGTGSGALSVCHASSDCFAVIGPQQPLVPLDFSGDSVPPACVATGVSADCEVGIMRNVLAFGLPAAGDPPMCSNPADVTVNTQICAPRPSDGFLLAPGRAIVFVYDSSLAGQQFAAGYGAFRISGTNPPAPCIGDAGRRVLSAVADIRSAAPLPLPTETPTGLVPPGETPTVTDTPKHKPTHTPVPVGANPGHGPLSLDPHASIVAQCIAACRVGTSTVADFLDCKDLCH